jgi:hypothetical protein
MLSLLRRTRALAVTTLLLFCGSVPASLTALMHDADDVLCQPRLVVHDESAHRVGAARGDAPQPQHCAICHWLQSLQTVPETSARVDVAVDFQHLHAPALAFAHRQAAAEVPARAPPRA